MAEEWSEHLASEGAIGGFAGSDHEKNSSIEPRGYLHEEVKILMHVLANKSI